MGIIWLAWHVYKRCNAPPETFQALTEDSDHEFGLGSDRDGGSESDRVGGKGSVVIEAAGVVTRDRVVIRNEDDDNSAVGIRMNTVPSIGQLDPLKKVASADGQHPQLMENTINPLLRAASNDSADGTASDRSTTNLIVPNANQNSNTSVNHSPKPPIKAIKPPPSV